jgi:hypothetical protein
MLHTLASPATAIHCEQSKHVLDITVISEVLHGLLVYLQWVAYPHCTVLSN